MAPTKTTKKKVAAKPADVAQKASEDKAAEIRAKIESLEADLDDLREADNPPAEYVTQSRKVDTFNTVRRKVKVTPSVCPHDGCGFDFCSRNGLPPFDEIDDPALKELIKEGVRKHRRLHNPRKQEFDPERPIREYLTS